MIVLSLFFAECVERIPPLKETEISDARDKQSNVAKTSEAERTLDSAEEKWKEDFLEKARQLLRNRLIGFGEGHYNIAIEDFTLQDSSINVMILKNDKKLWTCEILCRMWMDDGSVLENVVYDRRWSSPVKLSDKISIRKTVQQMNQFIYNYSIEISEVQDSASEKITCIDDAINAYQNAKNREQWKKIMQQKVKFSTLQQGSACDELQVQVYSFQTQAKVQYYFVENIA